MATYYAIVKDGFIQFDTRTDRMEIYETELAANLNKRNGYEVVKISCKREVADE